MNDKDIIAEYLLNVENGTAYRNAEIGHLGRRGSSWMKQIDRDTSVLIRDLGHLSYCERSLINVCFKILRGINPHASIREFTASLYRLSWAALSEKYDDVERRSGPESFRASECIRDYTVDEKIIVLEFLGAHSQDFQYAAGWCLSAIVEKNPNLKNRLLRIMQTCGIAYKI